MAYLVERIQEYPVVLVWLDQGFIATEHTGGYLGEVKQILDAADSPLYLVIETSRARITVTDLVNGLWHVAKPGVSHQPNLSEHPQIRGVYIVTSKRIVKAGTEALKQTHYGRLEIKTCQSLDEVLSQVGVRV